MNQPQPVEPAQQVVRSIVTPAKRVVRTVLQLVVGLAATVPLAAAAFDLSTEQALQVSAVFAFLVAALSVVQNVIEGRGGEDTPALGTPVRTTTTLPH